MTEKPASKLKILYVTGALNVGPATGCMMRAINVCRQLSKNAQITMLAVSKSFDPDSVEWCKKEFENFYQIRLQPYSGFPSWWGRFLKKWQMHCPFSRGVQASKSDRKLFQELVSGHDMVWFHTLTAANPFSRCKLSRSVMDLDDLNYFKFNLRAQNDKSLRLKLSSGIQSFKWKRHEFDALKQYDIVTVCSHQDKQLLGADNVYVIPNGYALPTQEPEWHHPVSDRLGFIGTLGYGPNRDGLIWFRDHVWPIIRKQKSDMCLRIIGKLPLQEDYIESDGFEYTGYLDDTTEEIKSWSSMIVPILYGGGTRIKILDAFSKMCPVVATSIGAYGIEAKHDEHLLLADNPEEFAQACLKLADLPEAGNKLVRSAWELFKDKYSWQQIGISIRSIAEELAK